jgi:HD-GYP domain-containing protein (c-di-GMP phosphodiesterase class II)
MSTVAAPPLIQSETLLQPLGRALVIACHAAFQSLRIYPIENATVQKALEEVHRVIRKLLDREGVIELRRVGDFLFINDARLRLDLSDYAAFSYLHAVLARHGIGQIDFEPGIDRAHLAPFLALLLHDTTGGDPFERFLERLAATPARFITLQPAHVAEEDPEQVEHAREVAKRTYFQSVHVAREVLTDARMGRAVNMRRVKRAVQSIVDQVLNNETAMLEMTALRDHDEYTFTHSVNVCIFSVVLGQKLGIEKVQLYELGLGALFHDIGKQRIDAAIINKPGALDAFEWEQMQRHPVEGLLMLFSMRGLTEIPYRAMLLAYEHHMKRDQTGYPQNRRPRQPTLFSRIVATVDGFDAATSSRSYQKQPFPPDEVLREMRDNPIRGCDPVLVKAFINVTGVYPVGTVAILDTFEMAVVTARNPDPKRIHQPLVRIISDAFGMTLGEPIAVDLAEVDPATGTFRRRIVKTVDPEQYAIRVGDYFL